MTAIGAGKETIEETRDGNGGRRSKVTELGVTANLRKGEVEERTIKGLCARQFL